MSSPPEHLDVVVIGAGLSGIGVGYYLQRDQPQRSYAILEARGASGGTWDLFRYPGIRSDSDLHTFGYEFAPWRDEHAIARGDKILDYLRATAHEYGIDQRIRYHRKVIDASWSTPDGRWTLSVEHTDTGERSTMTASWLFCAGGYFRYDEGYTPDIPGLDGFAGTVVHPQHWPPDLDVTGKDVVVIGSGATAVTLVPELAKTASRVTMLQRTPSYVLPVPSRDKLANRLRRWLGEERAYPLIRRINARKQQLVWLFCRRFPGRARRWIAGINARMLPDSTPVDPHFTPPYEPWDQRLCFVPNGDLFRALQKGTAAVVTDTIDTVTPSGVRVGSGEEIPADVVITATGLNVQVMGGLSLVVDGEPVVLRNHLAYKGMMLSGVPNLAYAVGYTNSSWTLKVGLICEHFTRMLAHLDEHGLDVAVPVPSDPDMPTRPFLDFAAGYVQRAVDELPRQGSRMPWLTSMRYAPDVRLLRRGSVTDPELRLSRSERAAGTRRADTAA